MSRRVVITGIGAITPVGNTAEEYWQSIKNGKLGIGAITKFDTSKHKVKIAAELKDFNPDAYMDRRDAKRMDPYSQYAIAAASQAMEMSGYKPDQEEAKRFGVMVGSGIGGLKTIEEQVIKMHEKGPDRVGPLFIPMVITNMAAGNIAIKFGAKGICSSIVTACASATQCVGEAFRSISNGYSDVIIAGGAEASITSIGIAGFTSITALSSCEDPARASLPFDRDRSGFVMGEGAGALVLEELEHALKRGAKIYGEVAGYGASCDAYHMTSPSPDGEGAASAMAEAVKEAGASIEEVGYINAHGTGTQPNDVAETQAIKMVFGTHAYNIPVSSTKSMVGHLLGAAGAVEAIACVYSILDKFVPPTIGLENPDSECDLDYVPKTGRPAEIKYALSNSFGFGGHNAVVCFKAYD